MKGKAAVSAAAFSIRRKPLLYNYKKFGDVMAQAAVLNNIDHSDLRIARRRGPVNGDNINQVRVFATEYRQLSRDYPIFFRRDDHGLFQSVGLLGLDKDENLFLEDTAGETEWTPRYIPALQERGPFSIGLNRDAQGRDDVMMLVDTDHPWVSREAGEPLFLGQGGNAPALERAAQTLRTVHEGVEIEPAMFQAFDAAGLIGHLELDLRLDETTTYKLPDLYTIRRDGLQNLDGATLERLNRQGFLELAFHVLASHDNLNRLIVLKNQRRIIF